MFYSPLFQGKIRKLFSQKDLLSGQSIWSLHIPELIGISFIGHYLSVRYPKDSPAIIRSGVSLTFQAFLKCSLANLVCT